MQSQPNRDKMTSMAEMASAAEIVDNPWRILPELGVHDPSHLGSEPLKMMMMMADATPKESGAPRAEQGIAAEDNWFQDLF